MKLNYILAIIVAMYCALAAVPASLHALVRWAQPWTL